MPGNEPTGAWFVASVNEESFWNRDSVMDPHEQFWTEEFFRYSAECRRLARLARKPPGGGARHAGTVAYLHWVEWLGDIHAQYINPPTHRPQYVASRSVHR